jgi:hypothetical protein
MLQNRTAILTGLGLGAGLMYFLDPGRGRRRRALVLDQVAHGTRITRDAARATSRDIAHRTAGTAAMFHSRLSRRPVENQVLVERVRARLGRLVSHPHALNVAADEGVVTLRGPILQHEVKSLLNAVERVKGVRKVVNELAEHKERGNIPSLQGGSTPREPRPDILQRNWSPASRLMAASSWRSPGSGCWLARPLAWRCAA